MLEVCLAFLEERFDKEVWPRLAARYHLMGARALFIAAARYADDCTLLSKFFCSACLFHFILLTYHPHIKFDDSFDGHDLGSHVYFKFLDFFAAVSFHEVLIFATCNNECAILLGSPALRKKIRLPLPSGCLANDVKYIF